MFDLDEQQHFCLGRRFSKHKLTRHAKNFGGRDPLAPSWLRLWRSTSLVLQSQSLNSSLKFKILAPLICNGTLSWSVVSKSFQS